MVLEVLTPGLETTIQDWPGRIGVQSRGFFPSGPADDLAFRMANALVANEPSAAALEITMGRCEFRVLADVVVAVTGAAGAVVKCDGRPVPMWQTVRLPSGAVLEFPNVKGPGCRLYLAIAGGIDVPLVMGSRATYTAGGIGGIEGRRLIRGDVIRRFRPPDIPARRVPQDLRPVFTDTWEVEVMRGPHADETLLTDGDWHDFVTRRWKVDLSSDRSGVRLNPHRFRWARPTGGVAGAHPSNILDGQFPLGGIAAHGDVLVILGPEGPTSDGFCVIATVVSAARWKSGQARPGRDEVRFREVSLEEALQLAERTDYATDAAHYETLPEHY
ncbi:biotin-dependent carboxyltransferase family protein [Amycolatopsis jejuensis]|uniref:biotin-dependent carboxyltransferase family protein n=1 Tax=Amycolatopsis jejuensis TaxID=330084 RepID=UPI000691C081|nr:biotin-dependent carboxyltransferase family protein [Amycolatopsis jejuensis]